MGFSRHYKIVLNAPSLLVISLSLLLVACSQEQGVSILDDYLDRLSNVLDTDREPEKYFQLRYREEMLNLNMPSVESHVYLAQSEHTIGLLDFLSLYGCPLQTLVAERNSGLGKLAKPSQQLLYELNFLHHSTECIDALESEGKSELANQLRNVALQKRESLPGNIWRVIIGGAEAKVFWKQSPDRAEYLDKDLVGILASINSLSTRIESWLHGDYLVGHDQFEADLAQLNVADGGVLVRAFLNYKLALNEGNDLIDQTILCDKGRALFNANVASNVVSKFFAGQVQAWASRLSQRYYELIPAYQALERSLEQAESVQYRQWREYRDAALESAIRVSKSHVSRLKPLLEGCSV